MLSLQDQDPLRPADSRTLSPPRTAGPGPSPPRGQQDQDPLRPADSRTLSAPRTAGPSPPRGQQDPLRPADSRTRTLSAPQQPIRAQYQSRSMQH
ncbi:hypothetical protein CesoFtcFv8_015657 [Champsocephalus esox]|uniref:Uncharacterized protein n=1 Tax=Champsocephalus esox TaxID=159716 RepID=A0AAN8GVM7_9TELE|nr:hypothetical protein CesoFtcFv8_015657 [Champsocephalus esox]